MMGSPKSDKNLLIGILSLQLDFIDRDQLILAMHAWVLDKSKPLDQILLDQNAFDAPTCDLVLSIVEKHISVHEGDAQKSLSALATLDQNVKDQLDQIEDDAMQSSLGALSTNQNDDTNDSPTATLHFAPMHDPRLRFQVLRPHAKGGLGQVSVALDRELDREVALKEIQERHADNDESRRRFVVEARVTGNLEHPGIVPVYGLGAFENGRPYYAMRLIRGDSLKTAADRFHQVQAPLNKTDFLGLEFRKLLGRFIDVCNAIEYAHSRGVLHRDLKPGNIMLGKYGETLVVDWGLSKVVGAKATGGSDDASIPPLDPNEQATETQVGTAIGTPAYMSPEQAAGRINQLGVATDVYSLGATLYYLLTNSAPFDSQEVASLLDSVQASDFEPPTEVNSRIPKALSAICVKAMAKDASQRYVSPNDLAEDVERWLAESRVSAYAEPLTERTWRWVKRHKPQAMSAVFALAVALVVVSIAAALVGSTNDQLRTANQDLDRRNEELRVQKAQAERQSETIQAQSLMIEDHRDFIRMDLLGSGTIFEKRELQIEQTPGQLSTNALLSESSVIATFESLEAKEERLAARYRNNPRVLADYLVSIGLMYRQLGSPSRAARTLQESLDIFTSIDSQGLQDIGEVQLNLAISQMALGGFDDAINNFEAGLRTLRPILGDHNSNVVQSTTNLATCYERTGQYTQALENQERAFRLASESGEITDYGKLVIANNLATSYQNLGRFADAEPLFVDSLARSRELYGDDSQTTLIKITNLATFYFNLQRLNLAEPLMIEAIQIGEKLLPPQSEEMLLYRSNLASLYYRIQKFDEAEEQFVVAIEGFRAAESLSPNAILCMSNYAALLRSIRRLEEAEELLLTTTVFNKRELGEKHYQTLASFELLASVYLRQNRFEEAFEILSRVLELRLTHYREQPDTQRFMRELAGVFEKQGLTSEAGSLYQEILILSKESFAPEHPSLFQDHFLLGRFYYNSQQYENAIEVFLEFVQDHRNHLGDSHPLVVNAFMIISKSYELLSRFDEAEQVLTTFMDQLQSEGPNARVFAEASTRLAIVMINQEKFLEAEDVIRVALDTEDPLVIQAAIKSELDSILAVSLSGQDRSTEAAQIFGEVSSHLQYVSSSLTLADRGRVNSTLTRTIVGLEALEAYDSAQMARKTLLALRTLYGVQYPLVSPEAGKQPPRPINAIQE